MYKSLSKCFMLNNELPFFFLTKKLRNVWIDLVNFGPATFLEGQGNFKKLEKVKKKECSKNILTFLEEFSVIKKARNCCAKIDTG